MPSKLVIILGQDDAQTYRYALWADVPAAQQKFYAGGKTVWKSATAADIAAFTAGSVTERTDHVVMAAGAALADVQTLLITMQQAFQAKINADTRYTNYGLAYDGTSWARVPV